MQQYIKNITHTLVLPLAGEVSCTHASGGDAMVVTLEGTGKITIDGTEYR